MINYNSINDNSLAIVNISKPLYIYTFCETDGKEELERAIEKNLEERETWTNHIKNYPDADFQHYLDDANNAIFEIMSLKEFNLKQRSFYLDTPLKEISEIEWDNMLNVLPPMQWVTINGTNEFLMSEMLSGLFTNQYARNNGKYYTKVVDVYDKSTWIHNLLQ